MILEVKGLLDSRMFLRETMESTHLSFEIGGLRREIKNSSHRKTASLHVCEGLSPTALSLLPGHSQKAQIDGRSSISAYYIACLDQGPDTILLMLVYYHNSS